MDDLASVHQLAADGGAMLLPTLPPRILWKLVIASLRSQFLRPLTHYANSPYTMTDPGSPSRITCPPLALTYRFSAATPTSMDRSPTSSF